MRESAEQMPRLIQTVREKSESVLMVCFGKERRVTCDRGKEDGEETEEDVACAHDLRGKSVDCVFQVLMIFLLTK